MSTPIASLPKDLPKEPTKLIDNQNPRTCYDSCTEIFIKSFEQLRPIRAERIDTIDTQLDKCYQHCYNIQRKAWIL